MNRREAWAVVLIGLPPIVRQLGQLAREIGKLAKEFVELIIKEFRPT